VGDSVRLVDLVQTRIEDFLSERTSILLSISDDIAPMLEFSRDFLSGGKRFRATFCYWGWLSVRDALAPRPETPDSENRSLNAVVAAASALEVFHAAALVHDDLIDKSDTRRGAPSAHRRFESLHRDRGWSGDAAAFGTSSALLLGDLLLGWSDELLDEGLQLISRADHRIASRLEFNRMRTEVTAGQYLDILDEHAWNSFGESELFGRAERVIVYKSAKYSVEAPLAIGATLAGADHGQLQSLRDFGLPLGIAYQLRDDILGVFGDANVTGKPSGDDLREGKRTILIALARAELTSGARRVFDELLGDPELDDEQIATLQKTIRASGAVERIETMISQNVKRALSAIASSELAPDARHRLAELAQTVTRRDS
jgi:geranylgeranyl diphosphate synthase type I